MKGRLTVFIKQTDMADGRRMTELIMKVNGKQDVDMVGDSASLLESHFV